MGGKKYIIIGLCGALAFLPFIPYVSFAPEKMLPCIFCEIVGGKMPQTKLEVETDDYVIFKDIKPASDHHYLAVPKRHFESLRTLTKDDIILVEKMETGMKKFFTEQGIDTSDALFGFHMPPFISVKHLHMHGIAPQSTMTFLNSVKYRPDSRWFKTVSDAKTYLAVKI